MSQPMMQEDEDDELFLPSLPPPQLTHLQRSAYTFPNNGETSPESDDTCFSNSLMQKQDQPLQCENFLHNLEQSNTDEVLRGRVQRQGSIVDGLLHEIYDRWHCGRSDSIDSDTLTECSSTSEFFFHSRHEPGGYHSAIEKRHAGQLNKSFLQCQSKAQLKRLLSDLQHSIAIMNVRLVKQLKRRDRRLAKLQRNFDVITAVLQAASLKRQIDTRMKFSIQPPPGQSAFEQWRDAMKAVCRLPMGMPPEFRKKVWLSLADHYLLQLKMNWEKTVRFVFNERSNPDDEQLGMQIVKDLHRTGCSNFSGDDNDEDRAVLKRLLLAYARWNKRVGYCQGFNVLAALLLNVMDRKEDDALKVMIYLVDSVLPESYFANNLRALSVDMAVFRDLLKLTYPKLAKHLDKLQMAAQDVRTGACYEPPLTNVFTMQWFLTLFATCLPVNVVLRVWDSILLEGSEILLRTALTIWGKLAKRIMGVSSADEFYCLMGDLSSSIMQGYIFDGDTMIKSIYSLGDFPFPHLNELREKYTYNIRPFSQPTGSNKKTGGKSVIKSLINSDDDDLDEEDIAAMACMPGDVSSSDISVLGPGVYGPMLEEGASKGAPQMERMSTDIHSLKLQYERLKERQRQAHIIIAAASAKKIKPASSHKLGPMEVQVAALVPNIESPTAMNHLFVGKGLTSTKNRLLTDGPRISAPSYTRNSGLLAKQLQAVANAKAVSKSQRMRTGISAVHSSVPAQPATDIPTSPQPVDDIPTSPPVTKVPTLLQIATDTRASTQPVTNSPATIATHTSTSQQPDTDIPMSPQPTTDIPLSAPSTTDIPMSPPPTMDIPMSPPPATDIPMSQQPTTDIPLSPPPTMDIPMSPPPATDIPMSQQPTTDIPMSQQPTTDIPLSPPPATDIPMSQQPTTDIPLSPPPTTDILMSPPPTTDIPMSPPTTNIPMSPPPTTDIPKSPPPTNIPMSPPPTTDIPMSPPPTNISMPTPPTTDIPMSPPPTTDIPMSPPTTDIPMSSPPIMGTPLSPQVVTDDPAPQPTTSITSPADNPQLRHFLNQLHLAAQNCSPHNSHQPAAISHLIKDDMVSRMTNDVTRQQQTPCAVSSPIPQCHPMQIVTDNQRNDVDIPSSLPSGQDADPAVMPDLNQFSDKCYSGNRHPFSINKSKELLTTEAFESESETIVSESETVVSENETIVSESETISTKVVPIDPMENLVTDKGVPSSVQNCKAKCHREVKHCEDLLPDSVGTNPVGTNPVGTNPVGTNSVGTNPVGTNSVEPVSIVAVPRSLDLTFDGTRSRRTSEGRSLEKQDVHSSQGKPVEKQVLHVRQNTTHSRRHSSPARTQTNPMAFRKASIPFNPFPVKHFNANRAKTGLKLGLYTASTLEQLSRRKSSTTT